MSLASSLWIGREKLVLASKSAGRRRLLEGAGLPFEVDPADLDERALEETRIARGESGETLAATLARAKALAVSTRWPGAPCLGADQTLTLDGKPLHKSDTPEEAARMLAALSGRVHKLTSAFALARDGRLLDEDQDSAELTMRPLDARRIDLYLACAGPAALASVGVYQVEGLGQHLFERIEGDHTTIVGLPMLKLLACLRRQGLLAL